MEARRGLAPDGAHHWVSDRSGFWNLYRDGEQLTEESAELGYPQRLRLLCYLCFWLWGTHAPSECVAVVRHRGGRMVPLCEPHLELSRRFEYRMPRVLPAGVVGSALLSAYAVDLLRRVA